MSFTPLSELGEFGLIERLTARLGPVDDEAAVRDLVQGIGDDAAVVRTGGKNVQVVTTDALVEGVHFDRTFMPMRALGNKAIAVNVSDLCAMNARPRWATIALGLPENVSAEHLDAFYDGVAGACNRYGVTVIGGDTTAAERLTISITAIGEAHEGAVTYRRGARPEDLLCVTGPLGAAYAGLRVLLAEKENFGKTDRQPDLSPYAFPVERQLAPQARVDVVEAFREAGVVPRAMIDISDGLASEVAHLCTASGCGAVIESGMIPVHAQTVMAMARVEEPPERAALYGGEDYELLFAAPQEDLDKLPPNSFAVVGRCTEAEFGLHLLRPDGSTEPLDPQGFRHF